MDEEIKTGEMTGEIDESITVEEDFTLLEGKAVSITDDSDNKTSEDEAYEEALEIKESLDDIRQQIKDKLLDILEKGRITDADGCEIELLNDQYNEKYNELKDIANTVIPGGKGTNSNTSSTEKIEVNIDYDELIKVLSEKADWLYTDEDGQVMINGDVVLKLKTVEVEAEKINWLVESGSNKSNMALTPELFELISKNITLTADHINLNGYVSNDDANWSIDNEGNIKAKNLKIEGDVGADILSVNYIDNPCYPATLAGSVDLYINADSGNDDYTIDDILQSYDEAEEKNNNSLKKKFKTIQGAIDAIPKFLNNKTVYIIMETNSTEDVYIRGVVGGAIRIYMNGKTLYGTLRSYACSATITTYGGTKDSTEGATGIIHPSVGLSFGSRAVSVGFEASQYCAIYKVKVFAPDNIPSGVSNTDKVCVASQAGTGSVYCKNVEIVNAVIGFRSNNHGSMHVNSSSGVASKYGFQGATGGIISIANNN